MKKIRLERATFHKFTLLGVSSIQTITIDFKERFHWLLGSNGSGKSSLIREATPLAPSDMKLFLVGGYREQLWTVDNKQYLLKSTRGEKANTHSFIELKEDGSMEELNYGHTQLVYNSLVDSLFGITKESHAVATGELKLTEMSAADRKAIFTSLSSCDYTYALAYYKRLYKSFRDKQGSLSVDRGRLVELRASNVNGDEEKNCIEQINKLKIDIEGLMKMRPNVNSTALVTQQAIQRIESEIRVLYNRMTDHSRRNKEMYPLRPIAELVQDLGRLEATYAHNEAKIDEIFRTYSDLTKKREELLKTSGSNREKIVERRDFVMQRLEVLKPRYLPEGAEVEAIEACIHEAQTTFPGIREAMYVTKCPVDNFESLNQKLRELNEKRFGVNLAMSNALIEIGNLEKHRHDPDTECPQCAFKFNPIYSEEKLLTLRNEAEAAKKRVASLSEDIEVLERAVGEVRKFNQGQDAFHDYIRRYPALNFIWGVVMNEKLHTEDPASIDQYFHHVHMDIQVAREKTKLSKELVEITTTLAFNASVSEDRIAEMDKEIRRLQEALNGAYETRSKDLDVLAQAKSKVALSNFIRTHAEKAQEYQQLLTDKVRDMYDIMEHDALNVFIRNLNVEISKHEVALRAMTTKNAEIIFLENNIRKTEAEVKMLKHALTALSPTEGLIAKGLTGFINLFNSLMNEIIARIMTYEMKIPELSPDGDNFELDFSIPIDIRSTNGTMLHAKDISKCSVGQKEIINLAWRVLYLKFKRLDATLLPLDEFGSNLDFVHRQKAFESVRQILSLTNFTQVLMVSHLSNTYGLMDGAGVTVICPANIQIPDGVDINETTTIVRA